MVQSLSDQGVPTTHTARLSGHKNLKSIENYSSLSTKQQQSMSNTLANISNEKAVSLPSATASNPLPLELQKALAQPQQSTSITDQKLVALFSGAVIQGRQFSVTINTVNQLPKITPQENPPWKRLRVSSSSSDED